MNNNAQHQQQQHGTPTHPPPSHAQTEQQQQLSLVSASSLVEIGSQLLAKGGGDEDAAAALDLLHSAHHLMLASTDAATSVVAPCVDPLSIIATAAVKQNMQIMMMQSSNNTNIQQHNMTQSSSSSSSSAFLSTCEYHDDDAIDEHVDCSYLFLEDMVHVVPHPPPPPDIYGEDEKADVGPRILSTPVRLRICYSSSSSMTTTTTKSSTSTSSNLVLMEAVTLFHKALIHHTKSQYFQAKQLYKLLACAIQKLLAGMSSSSSSSNTPCVTLLEIGMRAHNNLGLLAYVEGDDIAAHIQFQASLLFSKELLATTTTTASTTTTTTTTDYRLEYATILSNWCRVNWMKGNGGDYDDTLYAGLQEILKIRSTLLAWDDADLAASHYNLAAAEYARQNTTKAVYHLKKYLAVAAHRRQNHHHHHETTTTTSSEQQQQQQLLDPIPALIYLLLLENENQDNRMSQELVRGLYTLQDKCQDEGQDSLEVANVLNFIGTLLFHKKDLNNALLFFEEELRVEDKVFSGMVDMSVSVTCNNIGRICQDLGRYDEALHYYERALSPQQVDNADDMNVDVTLSSSSNPQRPQDLDQPTANLYSTVWYNIGLIHDRRSAHAQAIVAFGKSLELRKSFLSPDHPDIACLYFNIGVLQMEQDMLDDASVSLKQALKSRASSVAAANKLDDQRVIKTFEKLAIMLKAKGKIHAAIDALVEVLRVLEVTQEFDTMTRIKDMALVLRSMSELYHAAGDVSTALAAGQDSVRHLDHVYQAYNKDVLVLSSDKLANIEQLVASILLVGSLYHEMCEPLKAHLVFHQAVSCLETTIATYQHLRHSSSYALPSSLHALQEVTGILATTHCAPQA